MAKNKGRKENLIPLTTEKAREIGKKGGLKSVEVRREKKLLSQIYAKVIDDESETIEAALKKKIKEGDLYYLSEMGKLTEGSKSNIDISVIKNIEQDDAVKDVIAKHGLKTE